MIVVESEERKKEILDKIEEIEKIIEDYKYDCKYSLWEILSREEDQ